MMLSIFRAHAPQLFRMGNMAEKVKRFNQDDYKDEIGQITTEIEIFKASGDKADESFLKVGELLVKTKNDKNLPDKHFTNLKKVAAKSLGRESGLRNINKVVAIAQCEAIQKNKDKLPKSWTTLSLLTSAENLEKLIEAGTLKATSSRSEVSKLTKKSTPLAPKWDYVELAGDTKTFTDEQVEALKKLLNGSEWIVKSKKVETDKKEVPTKKTKTKK